MLQNRIRMLPSFEIYLSILSDSWMPWLDDNRRQEKFVSLLFALKPAAGTHFARFFRDLLPALKNTGSSVSAGFTHEAGYLAGMKGVMVAQPVAPAFIEMPVGESRDQFYHAITGYAFDGYRNWLETALPEKEGEISAYVVTRTADRLQSVLQLPVTAELTAERELRLLYLVKVAAATLFCGLLEQKKKLYRGIVTPFQTKELLRTELSRCRLPAEEKRELLRLMEQLQEAGLQLTKAPSRPFLPEQPKSYITAEPEAEIPGADQLQQLSREWQNDVADIKNAVAVDSMLFIFYKHLTSLRSALYNAHSRNFAACMRKPAQKFPVGPSQKPENRNLKPAT